MIEAAEWPDMGLSQETRKRIRDVLAETPDLEQAILYGSRAMGTYRPGSDIDLTLKGDALTWRDLQQLELALDDLLLPYRFDLSLYHQIDNLDLLAHIEREGVLFHVRGGQAYNS